MVKRIRLAWMVATLVLAGCPESSAVCTRNSDCVMGFHCSGGSCEQDCTPESVVDDCGEGASCNTFGMCVSAPDAGPRPDGGADSGVDGGDPRPACVIVGGTDADGDGYCAAGSDADCDETDAAVSPGADEVCTDSSARAPVDENCDGVIDDGCAYAFGVPHGLSDLATSNVTQWFPRLSADGLTIYFGGWDWDAIGGARYVPHVATRPSLDARFGAPSILPGTWTVGSHVAVFSPRADGLEAFIQVDFPDGHREIHSVTRATTSAPFAAPTPVIASTGSWLHPAISTDALELYFTGVAPSPAGIYRAVRPSVGATFGAPQRLDIPSAPGTADAVDSPWPMDDGSIIFAGRAGAVQRLFRAAPGPGGTYLVPVELEEISDGGDGFIGGPFYSSVTRELFFTSGRSWSPGGQWSDGTRQGGIWRAEVCRDGPCPDRRIACATGMRSPDLVHCYTASTTPVNLGTATGACVPSRDTHLATIHSEAENELVFGLLNASSWLGGEQRAGGPDTDYVWVSGEPFVYTAWAASPIAQPGTDPGEDFLGYWIGATGRARWGDWPRSVVPLPYVCETEMWPTW